MTVDVSDDMSAVFRPKHDVKLLYFYAQKSKEGGAGACCLRFMTRWSTTLRNADL